MMQSLMLAGNSGGDRARGRHRDGLHRPPLRGADPALRDRPRAAGGNRRRWALFAALWFLAIGLIFGAEIDERRRRRADRDRPGHRRGAGGRRHRRRDRPAHRQRQRRPGPLPAGPRRPLPLLRLLPRGPDDRAGARRSPNTTRSASSSKGSATRSISGIVASELRRRGARRSPASSCSALVLSAARPATPAEGRLMEARWRRSGWRAEPGDDRGADGAGQERAAAGAGRGDPGRAGADDLLPRPQRRLRRASPSCPASTPRQLRRASSSRSACCRAPASPAPRPASTWPATSSRAGSTGCSSPPPRAGCCSPARCSRPAPGR